MKRITLMIILLFSLILLSAGSCNKLKSAAQGAYDIDTGVKNTQAMIEKLNLNGTIKDEDYLQVLYAYRDLSDANREFRLTLIGLKEISPNNKYIIIDALNKVAISVEKLSQSGTLHIKNQAAKNALSLAVTSFRSAIAAVQIFLISVKAPVAVPAGLLI